MSKDARKRKLTNDHKDEGKGEEDKKRMKPRRNSKNYYGKKKNNKKKKKMMMMDKARDIAQREQEASKRGVSLLSALPVYHSPWLRDELLCMDRQSQIVGSGDQQNRRKDRNKVQPAC